jgi:hypothetical protein
MYSALLEWFSIDSHTTYLFIEGNKEGDGEIAFAEGSNPMLHFGDDWRCHVDFDLWHILSTDVVKQALHTQSITGQSASIVPVRVRILCLNGIMMSSNILTLKPCTIEAE